MFIVLLPLELIDFCYERTAAQKGNYTMLQNKNFAVKTILDFLRYLATYLWLTVHRR